MISFHRLNSLFVLFGLDLPATVRAVKAMPGFLRSYSAFDALRRGSGNEFPAGRFYPCLADVEDSGGTAGGHYFHQDLLVARRIYEKAPRRHGDVGSRIDGFVAHVAVFREIEVFDIRPVAEQVRNIRFRTLDLMQPIEPEFKQAYDSLSCLHVLEHFGLGRYGDTLDYYGYKKGLATISELLMPGGALYLSVPMGRQRFEFNAHRVFSLPYLLDMCRQAFDVADFSYVDDAGRLYEHASLDSPEALRSYDCEFGLAILELVKK